MKTRLRLCLVVFALLSAATQPALADDPKARDIMQKVEDRDDGDNITSNMEMILVDKHNQKRVRKIATFSKDKGEDTYRLMFFLYPEDVKDTSFLTYDYEPIKARKFPNSLALIALADHLASPHLV